jgi:hypothetical protein
MATPGKPKPRRISKYASGAKGRSPGSKAALKNAPPAPKNNVRAGKTLVRSRQPEKLVTGKGDSIADTRALVIAMTEDAATNKTAFSGFVELLVTEWHHVRVCAPHIGEMSLAAQKVHLRRVKLVASMFAEAGLTPTAAQRIGLMGAKEMEARVKTVKPVRTAERAREVANLLDQFGVLPAGSIEPVDAEVVEGDSTEPAEPDTEPEPPPLPEAARRDLGVRSIFDRKI